MNIKSIAIKNFRGFGCKSFELDDKVNVIVGDNTTGKTTLLHAIQIALGAYLQALSIVPGGKFFSRNFKKTDYVSRYSEASKSFLPAIEKPSIEVFAKFLLETYNTENQEYIGQIRNVKWNREGAKISRKNCGELMDCIQLMETHRRQSDQTKTNSIFPLMLSFGATRLDKNYNGAEKTKARASREEKAYKCALDEQVNFRAAFDWIYSFEKSMKMERDFGGTDLAFQQAIMEAIPAIKHIDIDKKNYEFTAQIQMASDVTPRWLTYDMMSDGFKSMINIVAEIAYRCIMLNGFLGKDSVKQTPGIVMIDELDLYLHPHWQQHILADLQKAFPRFQFIITTHSPFIVQSVGNKNVIKLDGEKANSDPNKRSIEEIAISEMNLNTIRSEKYNQMLAKAERYYQLVKEGKKGTIEYEQVKKELDDIELEFSDEPAYVSLLKAERISQ